MGSPASLRNVPWEVGRGQGVQKSQEKEGLEIKFRLLDAQPVNDAKEQSFPYTGSLQAG